MVPRRECHLSLLEKGRSKGLSGEAGRGAWVENGPWKEESFLGVFGKKCPVAKQGPGSERGVDAQTWGQRGWLLALHPLGTWKIPRPEQEPLQGRG